MDITIVIDQMVMMMIMLCVGVIGARTGEVDAETNRRLSRFAMAIPQSAIILASAMNMQQHPAPGRILLVLGAGAVMHVLLLAVCLVITRVFRVGAGDRGLYAFLGTFGNIAFMGYPILRALYGSDAVFYASLLSVSFNLLAFTVGIRLMGGREERFDWRRMLSPALVASMAAVVLIFLPVRWPEPVMQAANYMGDMITPLSMIIIGASLGDQRLRDVFGSWRAYAFSPVKLLLAPVLVWAVMRFVLDDPMLLGLVTVEAAMPSATVGVMLSIQYGANERLASQTVFITTVLSVVTIPLVCWVLL